MHEEQAMHPTIRPGMSRRQALRTAGIGAAATAFLAACGKKGGPAAGRSGTPTSTTAVAPAVPAKAPTTEDIAMDVTLLRTGTSLELLAAKVYDTYGPKLDDAKWSYAAALFSQHHTAAAGVFNNATPPSKRVSKPNKFVTENTIDPVAETLTTDDAILGLFHDIESTIAATYVSAAGTFTSATWRARVMTLGSASARRVTVLANQGQGGRPEEAFYPLSDLISNDAYVLSEPKKAGAS